jgi:hypothetical protein
MGQAVYVLTTRMSSKDNVGKATYEWRPVGVVSNVQVADEWKYQSDDNDWIPLELDDLSMVEGEHTVTPFRPRKPVPTETRADQALKNVQEINTRLIDIVEHLAKKYKDKEVLKLVTQLKSQSESQSVKPSQKIMSSTTAGHEDNRRTWQNRHAPGCPVRETDTAKLMDVDCTCLNDVLGFQEDLSGKYALRGCKDCGAAQMDDEHKEGCPRMAQRALFASALLRKRADQTYLWHGTSDTNLDNILANGITAPSHWGTDTMADYFAEGAAEAESGNPIIFRVPLSRFNKAALAIDKIAIQEPITEALGKDEDTLMEEWSAVPGEGTWQDCLRIFGAVKYNAPLKVTKEDIFNIPLGQGWK